MDFLGLNFSPAKTRKMNNNNQIYKCKVAICSLSPPSHFCRCCCHPDSDHLASQCPDYDPALKCKVFDCFLKHRFHYCKKCDNQDSDHFSILCPFKPQPQPQPPDHYCRFCDNKNSNHFARDCPNNVELCHATKLQNVEQQKGIGKIGLQPGSANCRFGQGFFFIYFKSVKNIQFFIRNLLC